MLPASLLVDADLFISYLTGDLLEPLFTPVVNGAKAGATELLVSSEVYDDVVTALRSQRVPIEKVIEFVIDMKKIPHKTLTVTADISAEALRAYREHGGSRKLHYFDSYHVATAKNYGISFLTSDKYVIKNAKRLGVEAIDVRSLKQAKQEHGNRNGNRSPF